MGPWPPHLAQGSRAHRCGLDTDFWLLDDTTALVMDYDDYGRFIAATRTDDPGVLEVCHDFRRLAIACSVPLQEYLQPA